MGGEGVVHLGCKLKKRRLMMKVGHQMNSPRVVALVPSQSSAQWGQLTLVEPAAVQLDSLPR